MNRCGIVAVLAIFLFPAACKTGQEAISTQTLTPTMVMSEAVTSTPAPVVKPEPKQHKEDRLIRHIKKNVHLLKEGMSRPQVSSILYLDTWFNGIVTSEGTKERFCYYYELNGYVLVLDFDYTASKNGAFRNYTLDPVI